MGLLYPYLIHIIKYMYIYLYFTDILQIKFTLELHGDVVSMLQTLGEIFSLCC